jgi:hypothetical protein
VKASILTRALYAVAVSVAFLPAAAAVVMLPGTALGGLACGVAVGAAAALKARENATGHARQITAAARRAGLTAFAAFVAVWLVVTGTAVLFGSTAWVVILVIGLAVGLAVGLAAAPRWVARRTWDPAGIGVAVAEPTVAAARPPVRPETLSTPELCLAWRRSYLALLDTPPGPARDELVRVRGSLLDELERRDHAGFTRWLEAGARAGSDPTRYLTTEHGE